MRASLISGHKLLVNNTKLKGKWGKFEVPTATGRTVKVTMRAFLWDPVPTLKMNGEDY